MNNIYNDIINAKLIIFDLGNVIIDVDVRNTIASFTRPGVTNIDKILTNSCAVDGIFLKLEKGEISSAQFCAEIRNLTQLNICDCDIIDAMNAMIGHLDQNKIRLIENLKKKHTVVLLSNTNAIHKNFFNSMATGYHSLSDLFDHTWYSHEMHMSKPSKEIFQTVLDFHHTQPSETIFFDDSEKNIDGARAIGIKAFQVTPERPIDSFFSNFLIQ